MAQFIFANNVNTTLAAPLTSSGVTLTLASSVNLPALASGQIMPLTLNDAATGTFYEIVYVTNISGVTLTVTRGEEGTSALNWSVGDYAACMHTAGTVASVNGNDSQTFTAAPATNPSEVPNLGQLLQITPNTSKQAFQAAASQTYTQTLAFTAPSNGFILAASTINTNAVGALPPATINSVYINGTQYGYDETVGATTNWGVAAVTAGQSCTVESELVTPSTGSFPVASTSQTIVYIFIPNP